MATKMHNLLKKNFALFILVGLCLTLVAYCQLSIPHLLALAVSNIEDFDETKDLLMIFGALYIGKGIAQGAANSLSTYLESSIRMDLISYIYKHVNTDIQGRVITMIKEDAERIASAITNTLNLSGSSILVIFTFYSLITETPYFSLPLIAIFILTARHLKNSSKLVSESYNNEINKEEKYKSSILELIQLRKLHLPKTTSKLAVSCLHMNNATTARYEYEKLNLKLCFVPEAIVAVGTALIIGLTAIISPKSFGSDYIYYLGYLGIFAMACRHSLETMLSLVGVNESIKRVFSHE